ncbi:Uncharacterised protein [Zhongshania aliphaticivorans]|uniref:TonB-dependent receptor n=1 Tax=Zhongshania aliphaticivorans TaxID=1470434 RepID=A0A5S9MYL5_9GAMM|nr:hypothetical protein [Zhongshania aliphaticivorans]CAA0082289.1 Uncharacterised protein [Zhongshania aliphaticivorans]CAA0084434.1 Uncharacterised protein [Zhongshania aliphaticivorans]
MSVNSFVRVVMLAAAAVISTPMTAMADEPVQLIEEVTVVGAVRNGSVDVADIDMAGDEALQEMPVAYE